MEEQLTLISALLKDKKYNKAISALGQIRDLEERKNLCFWALGMYGLLLALEEHGRVAIAENREKYERAKAGLEDISPYTVLEKRDGAITGECLSKILDFIPEDNLVKQYWYRLNENGNRT